MLGVPGLLFPVFYFGNLCLVCLTFSFTFLVSYLVFVPAVFPGVSNLPYYLVCIYNLSSPFALPHVLPQCSVSTSPVFHDISDILVSYSANILTFSIPLGYAAYLFVTKTDLSDFTNQTRLKAYPRFLRHQIMSTYLLLLLPQNVLKNKNKKMH